MIKKKALPGFLGGVQHYVQNHPLRALTLALGACAAVLLVVVVLAVIGFASLAGEFRARNEALTKNLTELNDDYNLLRRSLGLAPKDFAPIDESASNRAAGGPQSPLEAGLAVIQSRSADEAKAKKFEAFKAGPFCAMIKTVSNAAPVNAGLFAADWVKKGNVYYSLRYRPDPESVTLVAAGIRQEYGGADEKAGAEFIRTTLPQVDAYYERVASFKKTLAGLGAGEETAASLKAKGLAFQYRGEDAAGIRAAVVRDKEDLLAIAFDKREGVYTFGEKKIELSADLTVQFKSALAALDARTAAEKRVDAVKSSLEESFKDAGFLKACRDASLEVAGAPRENEDFFLYDVSQKGDKIGAVAVNKDTAAVYFVDKDDIVLSSLQSIAGSGDFKKKILAPAGVTGNDPVAGGAGANTFLLLGRNEENTDTMILVRADERTKSITLISLPRDLFYHGSRINRFHLKGFDYCTRKISEITGLPVEKFALIDIYSLISLIDVLGGVDIDLPYDVVDPDYRIKENGVWQTLAYPRGHYHLSGVQALRLIRSRQSTSDFQRAHRQQIIIAALFEKLKTSCGGNIETALSVFSNLAGYVTTNLPPLDIARDFIVFKDYKVTGAYVLDTTNILYDTYSGLYRLPEEEQQKIKDSKDEDALGAYILLPRNDDWDMLRSYIRVLLARGR